jgi:hypothetical protein
MRTYVDPALLVVKRKAKELGALVVDIEQQMMEADALPQSATKAGEHQRIQRALGASLTQIAADINKVGAQLKATA